MSIARRARTVFIVLLLVGATALSACSTSQASIAVNDTSEFVHITATDPAERLIELTDVLLTSADEVIVAEDLSDAGVLERADSAGLPLVPDSPAGQALVTKLGAQAVSGRGASSAPKPQAAASTPPLVVTETDLTPAEQHLIDLAGASVLAFSGDPREQPEVIAAIGKHDRVVAIGTPRYPIEVIYEKASVAGGKYVLFDDQHFIALYGHPSGPALGLLGEQGSKKSVTRVNGLITKYEKAAPGVTFQPAFEIITTVASAAPGPRKDYSGRTPIADLRPLIDMAKAEGITVILDLQPGRANMLEQAKYYEELLLEPHVGLALDPEWKLGKKGKPLQRIGHVSAKQVNEVSAWLAKLTRENVLPQKMFVLHQFQTQMIRDRDKVRTDHPELATVIHVDGQGPTAAKHATWRHIRKNAPKNVHWGWKNFIDEDVPMLNPKQTWKQVKPHPGLITYQ